MIRRSYFPILDPLRFIASICVLLAHSVAFFEAGQKDSMYFCGLIRNAGYYGVLFFYVLSGFLITYLLLVEKEKTGRIDIRSFYLRRILRIWPLYYFILILSFFVLPFIWPWKDVLHGSNYPLLQLLLYAFFLPNIASHMGPFIATSFQLYTIGYEEQFYLFWPLLMRMARKALMPLLFVLFFGHLLLEVFHLWLIRDSPGHHGGVTGAVRACLSFINYSNLPAFVAGAFAALVYLEGGAVIAGRLRWKGWGYILGGAVLLCMSLVQPNGLGLVNIMGVVFAGLILHLVLRPAIKGNLPWLLSKGGKISYGIYMFHPAVFILVSAWMRKCAIANAWVLYFLYLGLSFVIVTGVSYLSYRFIERPFLKRKPVVNMMR